MIRQCPCGFATNDQPWFESHQARHLLRGGGQVVRRDHDLSGLTAGSDSAPGESLKPASRWLGRDRSKSPIMAQIRAIEALGPPGLPGSPLP